jgi:tetratricopeptide (TPR) repeat protein/tRNA A-37 threonylcarbamoyl transferase component Bud32
MSDQTQIGDSTLAIPRSEAVGGRIGPFKILQLIGEGGFGSVFEAEQEHPVKRRVALKIIKLGMDTREVITRFEAERQALAMMDHPNIARVLDAGATDSGRPYFVMELVEGEPISGYCNRHKLPIDARLRLFEQVCAAVQHAHTKGIIHRDLKPNNVLVSTQDGQPFAKVIDFGIAKATSGRLTDKTMFTEANLMMGTPLYMSPEQAEGSADIDTRTDIYSLGVILYELLTGSTPIDSNSLRAAGYAEVQRIIREVEPLRPSARLSHATTAKAHVAQLRQTEPRKLSGAVRGELDWIVMKAIEKDRTRRYETANAFAMDVRRYLSGEPVLAVPPGAGYRFGKFVRRHRGPVVAGALIAAALLAGIAGFAWQARIARARVVELAQVAEFEAAMLGQVDPAQTGKLLSGNLRSMYAAALVKAGVPEAERNGKAAAFADALQQVNTTDAARDLIDSTVLKPAIVAIDQRFRGEPLVDAYLRQTLADRYVGMGLYDAAAPLQRSALATRRRLLGEDNPATLQSILNTGVLLQRQGRVHEAEPYYLEALQKMRHVLGADSRNTLWALNNLGVMYAAEGLLDKAEPYERETLAIRRRTLGEDNQDTVTSIINVGVLLRNEDRYSEAEPFLREAVQKTRQSQGGDRTLAVFSLFNLGLLLEAEGKLDAAGTFDREALDSARREFGENNQTTLLATIVTGGLFASQGRYADAVNLLAPEEAVVRKAFTGANAYWPATLLMHLGEAHTGLGNHAVAEAELLEARSILLVSPNARARDLTREYTRAFVALYVQWNRAEPGKGYNTKAAAWKQRLAALGASTPAPAAPH